MPPRLFERLDLPAEQLVERRAALALAQTQRLEQELQERVAQRRLPVLVHEIRDEQVRGRPVERRVVGDRDEELARLTVGEDLEAIAALAQHELAFFGHQTPRLRLGV